MRIVPLAIRGVAAVGDVDEMFARQLGAQRLQNAPAANAGVEDADGGGCCRHDTGTKLRSSHHTSKIRRKSSGKSSTKSTFSGWLDDKKCRTASSKT